MHIDHLEIAMVKTSLPFLDVFAPAHQTFRRCGVLRLHEVWSLHPERATWLTLGSSLLWIIPRVVEDVH